jgi:hypothetical protein
MADGVRWETYEYENQRRLKVGYSRHELKQFLLSCGCGCSLLSVSPNFTQRFYLFLFCDGEFAAGFHFHFTCLLRVEFTSHSTCYARMLLCDGVGRHSCF